MVTLTKINREFLKPSTRIKALHEGSYIGTYKATIERVLNFD